MRIVLDLQGAQSESRFRGIGRYSLALAQSIAQEAVCKHEIWLALSGRFPDSIESLRAAFAELIPRDRIRVFELPGPVAEMDPANAWRTQTAELLREKFLADLRPDVLHVSTMLEGWGNEVVASVGRFSLTIPTAVTLYDLIPLRHPDTYLSNAAAKSSYLRHAHSLKRADLLLAISEHSRREAIEALQISPERIRSIGAGVQQWFHEGDPLRNEQTTLMARCGLQRPFVLYTSAFEPRKNLEGLIAGYGLLPQDVRARHQLVLAGKLYEEQQAKLVAFANQHGLNGDEMVCLGYVNDADLRLLYAHCSVFAFPSLHEGFGLPVLEAMAAGAPVVGSNCTSIPEIIDRQDALFDPRQPHDIANRIAQVLSNPQLRHSLKTWGRERAKAFTWQATARRALDGFEALHEDRMAAYSVRRLITQHRPLLAFVSPLPPEQTAIAEYSLKLLPNLARHYEIVCIVDQREVSDPWINAEFAIRDLRWFAANTDRFERIVYQFCNSPSHKHMFSLLERHPGVVVLHDFHLGGLLNWMANSGFAPGIFTAALYDSHGFSGLQKDREDGREASIRVYPCNAAVLRNSVGVIVHSKNAIERAREWFGDSTSAAIRYIPPIDPPVAKDSNSTLENQIASIFVQENHPEWVAKQCRDVIEQFYHTSPLAMEHDLVTAVATLQAKVQPSDTDLEKVATALAGNRERFGNRQILLDVTNIAHSDAHTGIQRATRALLNALVANPPPGYRIEPVRAAAGSYVYARRFTSQAFCLPAVDLKDDGVEASHEDIFLALEWGADVIPSMKPWFLKKRQHGVQIVFLVYDMLPVTHPEFFQPEIAPLALAWIRTVTEIADRVACISRTVADELYQWLTEERPPRVEPLSVGYFHLGADLQASLPTKGLPNNAQEVLAKLRDRPSFLMVGTLEPRKGYRQALAAMERLWLQGSDANLVIVGSQGWMMDDLVKGIRQHPEYGRRLFWLQGISDEMLDQVYQNSSALIAASEGEGFGLPLVEAANHGLPIIARDIPVFRETAGEDAYYFRGERAEDLSEALRVWLSLGDAAPASNGIRWHDWHESRRQLLDVVLGEQFHRSWPDTRADIQSAK
ncbi:MAG: glycosyltransferase family 4 protein, partial [Verrucomicrobia bacterium]|nr:glycosyltransferase family 4 protein [Verrucomicrobiota bacterium]